MPDPPEQEGRQLRAAEEAEEVARHHETHRRRVEALDAAGGLQAVASKGDVRWALVIRSAVSRMIGATSIALTSAGVFTRVVT